MNEAQFHFQIQQALAPLHLAILSLDYVSPHAFSMGCEKKSSGSQITLLHENLLSRS